MEEWKKWEPIQNLAAKYYIDAILDDIEEFKIILSSAQNESHKLQVLFEHSVDAYRSTDESFRLELINTLDKKYGTSFYGKWTFFKVLDSHYLQWLSEQSYGIFKPSDFIHFSFIAADSILDIATTYEPTFTLINKI